MQSEPSGSGELDLPQTMLRVKTNSEVWSVAPEEKAPTYWPDGVKPAGGSESSKARQHPWANLPFEKLKFPPAEPSLDDIAAATDAAKEQQQKKGGWKARDRWPDILDYTALAIGLRRKTKADQETRRQNKLRQLAYQAKLDAVVKEEAPAAPQPAASPSPRLSATASDAEQAVASAALRQHKLAQAQQAIVPYLAAAKELKAALQTDAAEEVVTTKQEAAFSALKAVLAARREAILRGDVGLAASGAFLLPSHRLLLWMGGLRPSEVMTAVGIQLPAWKTPLTRFAKLHLLRLLDATRGAEEDVARAYDDLRLTLLQSSLALAGPDAPAPVAVPAAAEPSMGQDLRPQAEGSEAAAARAASSEAGGGEDTRAAAAEKLAGMRVRLLQAEGLRIVAYDEVAATLEGRQRAIFVLAPAEMLGAIAQVAGDGW